MRTGRNRERPGYHDRTRIEVFILTVPLCCLPRSSADGRVGMRQSEKVG